MRAYPPARFVAARHEMMLQLLRLVSHCRGVWVRCLRLRARIWPSLDDCFLMDYYSQPPRGDHRTCLTPRGRHRCRLQAFRLRSRNAGRPLGGGSGTPGALCMEHGAPSCAQYKSLGWGISRYCRAGHEGHNSPLAGPVCLSP